MAQVIHRSCFRLLCVLGALMLVGVGSFSPIQALAKTPSDSSIRIASSLVDAVEKRLALAVSVAAAKRASGSPVEDPVRESQAADSFVALVTPHGIPERAAREFIQAQFEASKFIQRTLLQQWESRPETAPRSDPPNLAMQVRPAIDFSTGELARTYVQSWHFARSHPRQWNRSLEQELSHSPGLWRWERTAIRMALEPQRSGTVGSGNR